MLKFLDFAANTRFLLLNQECKQSFLAVTTRTSNADTLHKQELTISNSTTNFDKPSYCGPSYLRINMVRQLCSIWILTVLMIKVMQDARLTCFGFARPSAGDVITIIRHKHVRGHIPATSLIFLTSALGSLASRLGQNARVPKRMDNKYAHRNPQGWCNGPLALMWLLCVPGALWAA